MFFKIGRTSLCCRDISVIVLGRTPSSGRRVISSHANYTDPLILWLQEGYKTGLALQAPWVQVQATSVLNLISLLLEYSGAEQGTPLRFQSSHVESSEESAEPELTSSADPEQTHYGEQESFCSDLRTFIIWGQEYFNLMNNEERNTCMRA